MVCGQDDRVRVVWGGSGEADRVLPQAHRDEAGCFGAQERGDLSEVDGPLSMACFTSQPVRSCGNRSYAGASWAWWPSQNTVLLRAWSSVLPMRMLRMTRSSIAGPRPPVPGAPTGEAYRGARGSSTSGRRGSPRSRAGSALIRASDASWRPGGRTVRRARRRGPMIERPRCVARAARHGGRDPCLPPPLHRREGIGRQGQFGDVLAAVLPGDEHLLAVRHRPRCPASALGRLDPIVCLATPTSVDSAKHTLQRRLRSLYPFYYIFYRRRASSEPASVAGEAGQMFATACVTQA